MWIVTGPQFSSSCTWSPTHYTHDRKVLSETGFCIVWYVLMLSAVETWRLDKGQYRLIVKLRIILGDVLTTPCASGQSFDVYLSASGHPAGPPWALRLYRYQHHISPNTSSATSSRYALTAVPFYSPSARSRAITKPHFSRPKPADSKYVWLV